MNYALVRLAVCASFGLSDVKGSAETFFFDLYRFETFKTSEYKLSKQ